MMQESLLVIAGTAFCSMATSGNAKVSEDPEVFREVVDARDCLLNKYIPRVFESLRQLALRADTEQTFISLSLEKDEEAEEFVNLGLHVPSEEEREVISSLYALEGRTVTFLSGSIQVHPRQRNQEQFKEQFTDRVDDVLRREFPLVAETLKLSALQADNQRENISLSLEEDEAATTFGLASLSEKERKVISDLFALEERTVTFLSKSVIVHPHRRIEEQLRARFSEEGGFYLKLGPPRKKS